ncbi:MAG: DNA cytosine methyltransferase [Acidimicrobiaceae bacterium]|nr:DNA cytosine methyltransferase [Acidimicrobiaceae bacterium]MYD07899.1 DNA cytosine methyltransferase [Acidimicrobiaceae bacterium]MYI59394.1 DNA cytosine methyltransferase [Acidimicrobiaceae bacterium]
MPKSYDRTLSRSRPTIVDLFCGAGGFSLGAHLAGFETVVAADIDHDLTSRFNQNFPRANLINVDLLEVSSENLGTSGRGRIAGVIGGPPCQGFSGIGRKIADDPRNELVVRFFELVAEIKPMFFVMENVPMLGAEQHSELLQSAIARLPSIYEVLPAMCLNAGDFGAATGRSRLILLGFDPTCTDAVTSADFEPNRNGRTVTVKDAISDIPEPTAESELHSLPYRATAAVSSYAQALRRLPPRDLGSFNSRTRYKQGVVTGNAATKHTALVRSRFRALPQGKRDPISRYPRLSWDRPSPVLLAGTGRDRGSYQAARPVHPDEPRVISVREAARLQGFPDWFEFSNTKWHSHRMIGNSVSPVFASAIMSVFRTKTE